MGILYQKRRLKANKIRRRINAVRTMISRFRIFLSIVLIISICYCGIKVLKLPQWYINIQKLYDADPDILTIQGNLITPEYKIINLIRQTQFKNTQIFRLSTKDLEENISQLQSVKKVHVRRYWFPARLVVVLDERTPAFLLAPNLESEPNSALTVDGVLIDHDYLPFSPQLKAKKLLTYGVKDGIEEIWDKKRVDEILKLTKAIETYSGQEVKYIDLRNPSDVYIMLQEYLIRFGEINDTSFTRAKWIASILPEAKKMNKKIKYIDLRWERARYFCLEETKEQSSTDELDAENPDSQAQSQNINKAPLEIQTVPLEDDNESIQQQDFD